MQRLLRTLRLPSLVIVNSCLATTYYVSPSGSHTLPYNTLATAATNIQSAVDVATSAGDVVVIDSGQYLLSTAVAINVAITVESQNGHESTIVDGAGVTRCFEISNVDCVLSGLTITNGYSAGDGGGIGCAGTSSVITNCIISGCSAENGGGIESGTIYHSIIRGNTAGITGGGAYFSNIHDSLIYGNEVLADYGGGAEACYLYNCTVTSNSAPDAGGSDNCTIYNSVIYSNIAPVNPDAAYSEIYNSCSSVGDSLTGSYISDNPAFENPSTGNYRLQASSPCINTGSNTYVSGVTDLDGNARIFGGTVDMGAYEVQTSASDADGDGMPDAWEIQYFDNTNQFPNANWDSDPFVNLEEYIAGTDPTNAASFFVVTNWSTGSFVVEWWPSVEAREYKVLWTDSLTNGFQQIGPMIDYPQNSYTDTAHSAESSGFYKVEVQFK